MPARKPKRRRFAYELTDEDKAEFLDLLYDGLKPDAAARELDTTGHQFRKLRRPQSQYYDPEFAEAVEVALTSGEHERAEQERIRSLLDLRMEISDTVLIKQALVKLPEWEPLRHQNFRHDIDIKIAAQIAPGMTREEIERVLERLEVSQAPALKALPPAPAA